MPQELLRDVCRSGDAMGRSRRRWSVLPLSIAAHAFVLAVVVIIPLTAEIARPTPAPPSMDIRWVGPARPPKMPVARPAAATTVRRTAAPAVAPSAIEPESFVPVSPDGPGLDVPGAVPSDVGVPTGMPGGTAAVVPPPPPPRLPPQRPRRVDEGIREPRKIVDVAPVYPAIAREARIEGLVILEAIIDVTGRVENVRVLRSVPTLDEAAVEAVRRWRYTPTLLNNVPVPVLMTITVRFMLR